MFFCQKYRAVIEKNLGNHRMFGHDGGFQPINL